MTVIVTAVFTPIEGKKAELIASMHDGITAVHEEEGCEIYAIHDAEDGTVTMIERWTTAELLDAHGTGSAIAVLRDGIAPFVLGSPVVTRMTPIPVGGSAGLV